MNILEEQKRRKPAYDELVRERDKIEKEIEKLEKDWRRINRKIKKTPSPGYFDIAFEAIEREYGCKTVNVKGSKNSCAKYYDLYAANSTPKQIQYRRPEKVIGGITLVDGHIAYNHPYGPDIITDYPETSTQLYWLMTHNYTSYIQKLWDRHGKYEYTMQELIDIIKEEKENKDGNSN